MQRPVEVATPTCSTGTLAWPPAKARDIRRPARAWGQDAAGCSEDHVSVSEIYTEENVQRGSVKAETPEPTPLSTQHEEAQTSEKALMVRGDGGTLKMSRKAKNPKWQQRVRQDPREKRAAWKDLRDHKGTQAVPVPQGQDRVQVLSG